jgi:predicted ATPase
MNLVLIGPHGAGKSTLAAELSRRLGWPLHPELGRSLAADPQWRPAGRTAADDSEAFDRELFARELERDLSHDGSPRIVETWHPGNLAYAAFRAPIQAAAWLQALRRSARRQPSLVVPLTATPAVLAQRQSEPGDPAFYQQVGQASQRWARDLGLPYLSPLDSSELAVDALATAVLRHLRWHTSLPQQFGA